MPVIPVLLISDAAAVRTNEVVSVKALATLSAKVLKMRCHFICTEVALEWHLLLSFKCQQTIVSTSHKGTVTEEQ